MSAASPPPPTAAGPPNGNAPMYGQENGGRSNRSSYGAPVDGARHIDDLNAEALGRARDMSNLPVSGHTHDLC
jgi:hypothetical protein